MKHYRIREGSIADKIVSNLPLLGIIAIVILAGLMNSWELGVL